ncbi:MAG: protein kinase [Marinicella sp.]
MRQLLASNYDQDLSQKLLSQTFGNFKPVKVIHQSDLSCVLLAERTDQAFEQNVIIKVLSSTESTDHPINANQEWQILAQLNHSGIAQIYDASITPDNHHYMIMEHIDGQQINHFCDDKKLSIKARIKLFLQVLDAVKYAHENLILHKDIKPANILVQENGDVKLLDFGIAGWVNESNVDQQIQIYTPAYASPEQIKGLVCNVKSDVYQLGLLLYQLLVGTQPYIQSEINIEQLLKQIETKHRTAPSDLLDYLESSQLEAFLLQRKTSLTQLKRILKSDLDHIILKCIKVNPEERYFSVEAFKQDLQRVLEHKPIRIRKKDYGYRLRKSLVRNVTAYLLTFLLSLAVISFTLVYINDINEQKQLTLEQKEKADSVSQYLINLLQNTDGNLDIPIKPSLDQLIMAASEQLINNPTMKLDVHRELVIILANSLTRMQNYQQALDLLKSVVPEGLRFEIENDQDFKFFMVLGRGYYDVGDFDIAGEIYLKLLQSQAYSKASLRNQGALHRYLAEVARKQRNYPEAVTYVKQAIDLLKLMTEDREAQLSELSQSQNLLAGIYLNQQQFQEAKMAFGEAISLLEQAGKENSINYIAIVGNYAILNDMTGDPEQAEKLLINTTGLLSEYFPERYSLIASHKNTLSNVKNNLGNSEAAIQLVKEAINLYIEHYGENYHKLVSPYQNLINFLKESNQCEEAEHVYKTLLKLRTELSMSPIDDFDCQMAQNNEQLQ